MMPIETFTRPEAPRTRHLALLQAMEAPGADGFSWQALSDAMRVLKLIDHWATGAPAAEIREALARLDAREGLEPRDASIDEGTRNVAAALRSARRFPRGKRGVIEALFAWYGILMRHVQFRLATHVIHTALELSADEKDLAWRCHAECGYAARLRGAHAEVEAHYEACIEIGTEIHSRDAVFRGNLGLGKVAYDRGNLPAAEATFRRLVADTEGVDENEVGRAYHELAVALGLRGKYAEAVVEFQHALDRVTGGDRPIMLSNLAYTHSALGNHDEACRIYLDLIASASHPRAAVGARVNLIEIYAQLGKRTELEEQRRLVEATELPPLKAVELLFTTGRAYATLDLRTEAAECFERSAEIGRQHGFGQWIIMAEDALAELSKPSGSVRGRDEAPAAPTVVDEAPSLKVTR